MLGDLLACWRMKKPAPGRLIVHPRLTFRFEEGAEVPIRLGRVFGDLKGLSAIDLGCGPVETPIAREVFGIPWRRLVSVEVFPDYVAKLRAKRPAAAEHTIVESRIEDALASMAAREIDLALLIDVLEHFAKRDALHLLARLERIARLGIVVFSPLGDVPQEAIDGNDLQRHRSTWTAEEFRKLGFDVETYEAFHGHLHPPADAAWAIRKL